VIVVVMMMMVVMMMAAGVGMRFSGRVRESRGRGGGDSDR